MVKSLKLSATTNYSGDLNRRLQLTITLPKGHVIGHNCPLRSDAAADSLPARYDALPAGTEGRERTLSYHPMSLLCLLCPDYTQHRENRQATSRYNTAVNTRQ